MTICTALLAIFNIFARVLYSRSCVYWTNSSCFTLVWRWVGWRLRSRRKCQLQSACPWFLSKAYTWFDLLLTTFQVLKFRHRQLDIKWFLYMLNFNSTMSKLQFLLWLVSKPFQYAFHFLCHLPVRGAICLPSESWRADIWKAPAYFKISFPTVLYSCNFIEIGLCFLLLVLSTDKFS